MKYVYNFHSFNEGLFSSNSDETVTANEVGNRIYDGLLKLIRFFEVKKEGETLFVEKIKLDENPGVYNIYVSANELKIEYYKNDTLIYKDTINCSELVRRNIFNILKKYYIGL